jgi:hypothetical protein
MDKRRMFELPKELLVEGDLVKRNEVYFDRAAIASLM